MKYCFLIPEAGGEAGFDAIQYYKKCYPNATLIAIDAEKHLGVKYHCDRFYHVPKYSDSTFMDIVKKIILDEGVTHLIPTCEHGLSYWSELVKEHHLTCCINFDCAKRFKDKYKTYQRVSGLGLATIPTNCLDDPAQDWSFTVDQKLYIKPRNGSGSKHNFCVDGEVELESLIPYLDSAYGIERFIVQPYTEGVHRTIDVCCSSNAVSYVIKKALHVAGSKIVMSEIVDNQTVGEYVEELVKRGKLEGIFNIELIQVGTQYELMEINTRLAGGTIYSAHAGYAVYEYCVSGELPDFCDSAQGIYYKEQKVGIQSSIQGVKAIMKNSQGSVLLTKRNDVPMRTIPGGGVAEGETCDDAIVREIQEELGYTLVDFKQGHSILQKGVTDKSYIVYSGVYDNTVCTKQSGEVDAYGLFGVDELPYPIDSITRSSIMKSGFIPFHENIVVQYMSELKNLMGKPIRGVYLIGTILKNFLGKRTFKL